MANDNNLLKLDPVPEQTAAEPEQKKAQKKSKDKKTKGPNRLGRFFKEIFSELKKVDWPSFSTTRNRAGVFKQTGVVLVVVLFFVIVVTLIDLGLVQLLRLLTGLQV